MPLQILPRSAQNVQNTDSAFTHAAPPNAFTQPRANDSYALNATNHRPGDVESQSLTAPQRSGNKVGQWWNNLTPGQRKGWKWGLGIGIPMGILGIIAGKLVPWGLNKEHQAEMGIAPPLPSVLPTFTPNGTTAVQASFGPAPTSLSQIQTSIAPIVTSINGATVTVTPSLNGNSAVPVTLTVSGSAVTITPTVTAASAQPTSTENPVQQQLDKLGFVADDNTANGGTFRCIWSDDAVSLNDQGLTLSIMPSTKYQNFEYVCGQVHTKDSYLYGTFSVEAQGDIQPCAIRAFFTTVNVAKGANEEIDMEATSQVLSVNTWKDGVQNPAGVPYTNFDPKQNHEYKFTWSPTNVTFFVDGQQVHQSTDNLPRAEAAPVYLSMWLSNPNSWSGSCDVNAPVPTLKATFNNFKYEPLS